VRVDLAALPRALGGPASRAPSSVVLRSHCPATSASAAASRRSASRARRDHSGTQREWPPSRTAIR